MQLRIIDPNRKNGIVSTDEVGKGEVLLTLRGSSGGSHYINLAIFQHSEHFSPRSVIACILEIQMGIFRNQVEKLDAITGQTAIF